MAAGQWQKPPERETYFHVPACFPTERDFFNNHGITKDHFRGQLGINKDSFGTSLGFPKVILGAAWDYQG